MIEITRKEFPIIDRCKLLKHLNKNITLVTLLTNSKFSVNGNRYRSGSMIFLLEYVKLTVGMRSLEKFEESVICIISYKNLQLESSCVTY